METLRRNRNAIKILKVARVPENGGCSNHASFTTDWQGCRDVMVADSGGG